MWVVQRSSARPAPIFGSRPPLISGTLPILRIRLSSGRRVQRGVGVLDDVFWRNGCWGFRNSGLQPAETRFCSRLPSQETVTWDVAYLATGNRRFPRPQSWDAFWQCNPCEISCALVSNKPGFSEQVDLSAPRPARILVGLLPCKT